MASQSIFVEKASFTKTNEQRLSLAFENLSIFPSSLLPKYSDVVSCLDLSHNKFRDVRFLVHFDNLETVILDHNLLDNETTFPHLPGLRTLWINHNLVRDLTIFIPQLYRRCPKLEYLSLMGNPGCRAPLNDLSFEQVRMYRYFVISYFPCLKYLDDRTITDRERSESRKYFPNNTVTKVVEYFRTLSNDVLSKVRPVQRSESGIV